VIAMHNADFLERLTTVALEAHFFSMFAPGFLTGKLIGRAGSVRVALLGIGTFGAAAGVLLAASDDRVAASFAPWCAGMALCGLAWNLCFSAGTVMLSSCYEPEDAARVQGANDFVIFAVAGAGSFGSGYIYKLAGANVAHGWHALVFVVVGLMALLLVLLLVLQLVRRREALPPSSGAVRDGTSMAISRDEMPAVVPRDNSLLSVLSSTSQTYDAVDMLRASVGSDAVFLSAKPTDSTDDGWGPRAALQAPAVE